MIQHNTYKNVVVPVTTATTAPGSFLMTRQSLCGCNCIEKGRKGTATYKSDADHRITFPLSSIYPLNLGDAKDLRSLATHPPQLSRMRRVCYQLSSPFSLTALSYCTFLYIYTRTQTFIRIWMHLISGFHYPCQSFHYLRLIITHVLRTSIGLIL